MKRTLKVWTVLGVTAILIVAMRPALADPEEDDIAYTNWAFVFNRADKCVDGCGADDLGRPAVKGAVIYLTGQRVQDNGRVTFAGAISAHSTHGQIGGSSPQGLLYPMTAEIHVGIQWHGPGSLDGDADSDHNQVTNPCPAPCTLIQAAIFGPGATVGTVVPFGGDVEIPGTAARMTRDSTGVKISIDTVVADPPN